MLQSEPRVDLVWITPDAEQIIGDCARVSSPHNQGKDPSKLIAYCIKHKHWSILEMASMCVELWVSRAIGRQILRHRSFSFQEFSQRYTPVEYYMMPTPPREQAKNNHQASYDLLPVDVVNQWYDIYLSTMEYIDTQYRNALRLGVAREQARFLLPEAVMTRIAMSGTIRSWVHFLDIRADDASGTQLEHLIIAKKISEEIFIPNLPTVAKAANLGRMVVGNDDWLIASNSCE